MLLGCWPSDVARRPAWEIRLLETFLLREPSALDRVEIAIARLTAKVHNAVFKPKQGIKDFLPYLKAWDNPIEGVDMSRYNEADLSILRNL